MEDSAHALTESTPGHAEGTEERRSDLRDRGAADDHPGGNASLHGMRTPEPPQTSRAESELPGGMSTRWATLALVGYVLLACLLFASTWRSPSTRTIGGEGDPLLFIWFLRWTPHAVTHIQNPFFTDHLNFPAGVNLMWNTLMFLPGLLLWPITSLLGPIVSYNALVTANVALSAWAAFWAFRRLVGEPLPAFVGGLAYGFSPYMMSQSLDHPNLTAAFIPPMLLVVLHEILVVQRRPPRQSGMVLGLLVGCQLLIAEEVLASQALAVSVGVLILAVRHRGAHDHLKLAWRAAGYALAVFAIVASWPLFFQFIGPQSVHGVIQAENVFVTDVSNLIVPTSVHRFAPMASMWTGNLSERVAYLGIPYLALLGIVVARHRSSPLVRFAAVLAVCLTVLSFGPSLHVGNRDTAIAMPWRLVAEVPVLNNMLPSRLMLYVHLLASLLLAVFAAHLMSKPTLRAALPGSLLVVVVLASLVPAMPYPTTARPVPAFFSGSQVRQIPVGTVVLVAPIGQAFNAEPMTWQAVADMRFRMPEGYFIGPDPNGHPMYGAQFSTLSLTMEEIQRGRAPTLTKDLAMQLLSDMSDRQVGAVLVGPMRRQGAMLAFFTALLHRAPADQGGGVFMWWDVDQTIPG